MSVPGETILARQNALYQQEVMSKNIVTKHSLDILQNQNPDVTRFPPLSKASPVTDLQEIGIKKAQPYEHLEDSNGLTPRIHPRSPDQERSPEPANQYESTSKYKTRMNL